MDESHVHRYPSRQRVSFPSHILYADDVIIFYQDSRSNGWVIMKSLENYRVLSGHIINKEKSMVYLGKHVREKCVVLCSTGMKEGTIPFIYPLFMVFRDDLILSPLLIKLLVNSVTERDMRSIWK